MPGRLCCQALKEEETKRGVYRIVVQNVKAFILRFQISTVFFNFNHTFVLRLR